jgi:hypothetical protein
VKTAVDAAADITHGPVFRAINKAGRVRGDGMSPKVLWDVGTGPDPVSLGALSIQTTERYLG